MQFEGIKMPKLSDTSDDYKVIRIHAKVGDVVKKGGLFLDVETDKAATTVSFYRSGKITELTVKEGAMVRSDALLGVMDVEE